MCDEQVQIAEEPRELRFEWLSAQAIADKRKAELKSRVWIVGIYPAVILVGALTGFYGAMGAGLVLLARTLYLVAKEKNKDIGFDKESPGGTATLTDDSIVISRGDTVLADLAWDELSGFTVSAKKQNTLTLHLVGDQDDIKIPVQTVETYSEDLTATLWEIEYRLPLGSKRQYEDDAPKTSLWSEKKKGLAIFVGGLVLFIVSFAALFTFIDPNDDSYLGPLIILIGTIALAVSILGFVDHLRTRPSKPVQFDETVWGTELARYEPDRPSTGSRRAVMWAMALFGAMWLAVGIMEFATLWYLTLLGGLSLAFAASSFHLLRLEMQTVVITDQYIYVKAGRKTYSARHGQYPSTIGSVLFGFRIPYPGHAIILLLDKPVAIVNRVNDQGMLFVTLARLNNDTDSFVIAQEYIEESDGQR